MIEAQFGGTGPAPAQAPGAGDGMAGPGAATGAAAPSSPPRPGTPDHIRAILAGISNPAPASPTLTVVPPAEEPTTAVVEPVTPAAPAADGPALAGAVAEDPGAVSLASVDVVLPHILESARAAGRPLSIVVARPGPSAVPGVRLAPPSPGTVADLAAALAVSLGPEQDLLADGPHHLVVTTLGSAPRRATAALMQRAAEAGAPMFTWAGARFPQDGQSAAELLDMARARVDGTEPVVEEERRGKVAAVWVGVAAALAVAAFAFLVHGHGSHTPSQAAGGGIATNHAPGGAASLSGGHAGGSGNAGGAASGGSASYIYSGPGNGGGGSSGTGSGSTGSGSTGSGSTGSGSTGSGGGGTATTVPSNSTATTIGNTTPTTTANTTNATTTTVAPTTTTTACTYQLVLGQLVCVVQGLLGH